MDKILRNALINSLLTVAYIVLVVTFIESISSYFPASDSKVMILPIFMLMLFVFSAAVTGALVFGRPLMWYLDSKKKEAIELWAWTITFIFVMILLAFFFMLFFI